MPIKGTYYNATLGAAPTNNTLTLGSLITSTIISLSSSAVPNSLNSLALTPGSWIIIGNLTYNTYTGPYALVSISSTNNSVDTNSEVVMLFSQSGNPVMNITRALTITSNQTWYLITQSGASVSVIYVNFYAMRIG